MAFTSLVDSIIETSTIADGYLIGILIVDDETVTLINYEKNIELLANDSLEVYVNQQWLKYQPYKGQRNSDGWPMFAGCVARIRKDGLLSE